MRSSIGQRAPFLIEWALAIVVVMSVVGAAIFFFKYGQLPQPFYIDYYDTYMDGYNTVWWAWQGGMYDVWQSVYPPLSFVWAKIFSLPKCYYGGSSSTARSCDEWFRYSLFL